MIYPQPNGTFHGTGIIGDIFFERADMAVAPLGIVLDRAIYIDYLPPIKFAYIGMYIKKGSNENALDLNLLLSPFAQDSWILMILTSIIIGLVKLGLLKIHGMPSFNIALFLYSN